MAALLAISILCAHAHYIIEIWLLGGSWCGQPVCPLISYFLGPFVHHLQAVSYWKIEQQWHNIFVCNFPSFLSFFSLSHLLILSYPWTIHAFNCVSSVNMTDVLNIYIVTVSNISPTWLFQDFSTFVYLHACTCSQWLFTVFLLL